ncbi:response regulator transcription factor [Massilia rhizosphaerae]|uniref:response regulator transcription factor n=1 Tax=Massilia rhizosphaerae TaxID=2784389 RepID=UPI0018DD4E3F|nr:response regulator transcription factor [Massilia rhizosphaerae]
MQLLLAEDDPILANGLTAQLNSAGFTVEHAPNGPVAEYLLAKQKFDIAIIDLGLPMIDGLTVLKKLRASHPDLPVVVLTALDRLDSRVAGLNAGADDYMTKPFEFPELEARLRAVLRRARKDPAANGDVAVAGLHFDRAARRAVIHGEPVELSPRESTLLELLLVHADKVVTKDQIAAAWAGDGTEVGAGNTAEVHIHRLRRKLEGSGLEIRTIRGLGYLLAVERADGRPG